MKAYGILLLVAIAVLAFALPATAGESMTITVLGTPGGNRSEAIAINNSGQVVGKIWTASAYSTHAFEWQDGTMKALETVDVVLMAASIYAFKCDLVSTDHYKLNQNSIVFYISHYYDYPGPYGPYAIKIVPLSREVSPVNHKAVKLNRRILFDDKEVSYANNLYLSTENSLYECVGSPPNGSPHIIE